MPNDKISKITLPDGTTYDIQDTTYSAGTGLSLSDTVINHSNSVTAQTTQAIYPITIDAQGHIGSYGNAASIPTKTSDLTNDSGYITGMTILSYGSSNWYEFITAYNANKVVYCRASSNSNPSQGSQTRLAFMAYVNNATTPTNVEFQYYRSVSSHTESQQGDQVYVYKLDKNSGWSVTTREASVKVAYNNGITGTYSNGVMTLKHANTAITAQATQGLYPIKIDAYGHITGYGSEVTSLPASDVSSWAKASTKPSYTASEVGAVAISAVGAASGVAPLNASSKIDQAYLPSYVDDVIEGYYYNNKFYKEAAHTTEITGEAGKIYIDLSTDKTYRYGGSAYAEVGGGSLVTISRNLTSGTKSATINIDGTPYDIYSVTNTDEKLKVAEVISGTTYYPVVSSNSANAETKRIDSTGFKYSGFSGGTNNTGCSFLTLGNNIEIGNVGNKEGRIRLYGSYSGCAELYTDANMTADHIFKLPNKSGTIALTTDIPSVPSWALASTKPSYALSEITGASDVQAIEALSGTSGLLKKTAANTWTLDTTAYTTNTGTVTKVTAGTGLAIGSTAQGNFTTSGTINHTNSVTAQTTQALYPIKIDACGHISAYGTAVTSLPASDVSAWAKASTKPSYALSEITGAEDVQAIEGLTGTSGLLKKTAANTWTLDTTAYTTNTGTVTKVIAGTGLAIGSTAQGNFTTSGTINHTNSVTAKTAAAQSAKTLTWGGTFTLYEEKYDACGHITGVASYNMTMPSNPNTDIKQNITLATTSKAYLTGVTTTPTSSAQALTGVADTGVYLTATAGEISAVRHSFNVSGTEKAYMAYNNTTNAIDFIFN